MADALRKLGIAAAMGTLLLAGISGCSSMSTNHVDCNVVKLQQQSGRSDAEIASALSASVDDVAKCHGPEHTSDKDSQSALPQKGY